MPRSVLPVDPPELQTQITERRAKVSDAISPNQNISVLRQTGCLKTKREGRSSLRTEFDERG